MNHIYIFALILNLIVGSYVLIYIRHFNKKHDKVYLTSIKTFTLFVNLLIFAFFLSKYIFTNVSIDKSTGLYTALRSIILSIFIISEFSVGYYIYKTICLLKEEPLSKIIKLLYFSYGIVFFILYANFFLFKFNDHQYIHSLDMVWELSINIFIIIQLTGLFYYSYKYNKTQNSLRSFGYIFFIGFAAYLLPQISFYIFGRGIGKYTDPIVLFFINITPWVWLHFFYQEQSVKISNSKDIEQLYEILKKESSISKREFEIINQIFLGKSNQEMCDILFISFHTVKNHIYSIFKKLDINSRSQLIHYINNRLEQNNQH